MPNRQYSCFIQPSLPWNEPTRLHRSRGALLRECARSGQDEPTGIGLREGGDFRPTAACEERRRELPVKGTQLCGRVHAVGRLGRDRWVGLHWIGLGWGGVGWGGRMHYGHGRGVQRRAVGGPREACMAGEGMADGQPGWKWIWKWMGMWMWMWWGGGGVVVVGGDPLEGMEVGGGMAVRFEWQEHRLAPGALVQPAHGSGVGRRDELRIGSRSEWSLPGTQPGYGRSARRRTREWNTREVMPWKRARVGGRRQPHSPVRRPHPRLRVRRASSPSHGGQKLALAWDTSPPPRFG
jgi:hypothetical protein